MISELWSAPTLTLTLSAHEVHIWRASLDVQDADLQAFERVLSPDERSRASRFYFEKHRARFVSARGMLRHILGRYVDQEPAKIQFCYAGSGKPALSSKPRDGTIHFNLSHSGDLALYAVARHREVGIDLEEIRPAIAWNELACRFFSPAEVSSLLMAPPKLQIEAFFHCWTRKEAYIKALGDGLHLPLDSFDVSVDPRKPAVLLRGTDGSWSLQAVQPAEGYVGAVVAKGHDWVIRLWEWEPAEPRNNRQLGVLL
jgi:4'-phosphopantetheinyl transferase